MSIALLQFERKEQVFSIVWAGVQNNANGTI
jgi:hypothetical protein